MRYRLFSFIVLVCLSITVMGQQTRDYAITDVTQNFSDDKSELLIFVAVQNYGTTSNTGVDVVVRHVNDNNREIVRNVLPPLVEDDSKTLQISIAIGQFPPSSQQTIRVEVGLDAAEITPEDNVRDVVVTIPFREETATNGFDIQQLFNFIRLEGDTVIIGDQTFERTEVALYATVALTLVIFLWLITLVLRMIFRRPPRFGVWQPPYAMMPMYDQNSVEGRRQAWQQYAQNCIILAAPNDGNLHPIKMLLGGEGGAIDNWKVTGLRLSQYDTYGRIARSQTIADKRIVKRLNRLLRRRNNVDEQKLSKMLRPIARAMIKQLRKNISKKSAFLPVALDLRLEGKHGEVRIFFELYQFQQGAWYRIDQWEPTMMVVTPKMQENFTFTIHGKGAGERYNDYLHRLQDDLHWLLLETVRVNVPAPTGEPQPQNVYNVPDTLSGMDPMQEIG